MIPDPVVIQELKDYIATDTGKTEAAPGCCDDTVIALAICAEVLRTHWDRCKLQTNRVSWKQQVGNFTPKLECYQVALRFPHCPHAAVAGSGFATNNAVR